MTLQVRIEELTADEFFKLWSAGADFVVREDPRKGYTEKEKKEAARAVIVNLVAKFLQERI
jgi:hypothetical protein